MMRRISHNLHTSSTLLIQLAFLVLSGGMLGAKKLSHNSQSSQKQMII